MGVTYPAGLLVEDTRRVAVRTAVHFVGQARDARLDGGCRRPFVGVLARQAETYRRQALGIPTVTEVTAAIAILGPEWTRRLTDGAGSRGTSDQLRALARTAHLEGWR